MREFKPTQQQLNRQFSDAVFRWDAQKMKALLAAGAELRIMDDDALRWALMSEPWGARSLKTIFEHNYVKRIVEEELASRVVRPFKPRIRRQDGPV